MMHAVDTNLLIYFFEGNMQYGSVAQKILAAADDGRVKLVASELALAELLSKPMPETTAKTLLDDAARLTITYQTVSREILLMAAGLRRQMSAKLPDAIHLANAVMAGASHFITNDRQLLQLRIPEITISGFEQALLALD